MTQKENPLNLETPESTYSPPKYKKGGMRNFANLVKTMTACLGISHVQFNTRDKKTLIDAQKNPKDYPALMVRVAGYSVYFTDLSKEVQDDVISRTEHKFG